MQVLQPVFAAQLGVIQESGPTPQKGDVLQCQAKSRKQKVLVNGEPAEMTELIFECKNKERFVIRSVMFQ